MLNDIEEAFSTLKTKRDNNKKWVHPLYTPLAHLSQRPCTPYTTSARTGKVSTWACPNPQTRPAPLPHLAPGPPQWARVLLLLLLQPWTPRQRPPALFVPVPSGPSPGRSLRVWGRVWGLGLESSLWLTHGAPQHHEGGANGRPNNDATQTRTVRTLHGPLNR